MFLRHDLLVHAVFRASLTFDDSFRRVIPPLEHPIDPTGFLPPRHSIRRWFRTRNHNEFSVLGHFPHLGYFGPRQGPILYVGFRLEVGQ